MIHDHSKKILVCTPSNKAVDEILSRVSIKGLIGTEAGEIVRIGSLEYQAEDSIKHLSLDQRVNQKINFKRFESIRQTMSLIDEIVISRSTILEKCQDFIHPVSKRIKISSESSNFFEALVEIIE